MLFIFGSLHKTPQKYQKQNLSFLTFGWGMFSNISHSFFSFLRNFYVLEFGEQSSHDSSIYPRNNCHGLLRVCVCLSVLSLPFFSLCFQFIVLCCHILYLCVWGPVCEPWEAWKRAWRAFRVDAGADHSGSNCSDLHCGRGRGRQKAPLGE